MVSTLDDIEFENKTILLQSNLDVPFEDGRITDDTRLVKSLPTINELVLHGCRVIVCGHIGRPKGEYVESLSTKQLVEPLSTLLDMDVSFLPIIDTELVEKIPKPGVAVLENLRMWPGEMDHDEEFAGKLASIADVFINDDYIDSHRSSATNTLVPKKLACAMGRTLQQEYELIHNATTNPQRPYVAIIGGAKKDKLDVVEHVLEQADHVLIGGVLANTFLKATGVDIKASKYDEESLDRARELYERAKTKIRIPNDCVAAAAFEQDAQHVTCYLDHIPEDHMILDIGPDTIRRYRDIISMANTIVWGGPIGAFEMHPFEHGTHEIAKAVAKANAFSVIAGGDSSAAIHQLGLADDVSHVSIGGGATLHLIAGDKLPAIESLHSSE